MNKTILALLLCTLLPACADDSFSGSVQYYSGDTLVRTEAATATLIEGPDRLFLNEGGDCATDLDVTVARPSIFGPFKMCGDDRVTFNATLSSDDRMLDWSIYLDNGVDPVREFHFVGSR